MQFHAYISYRRINDTGLWSPVGGALLAFTVSFDAIPVTFFITGRDNTLPMYICSTLRCGITPENNAIGTVIVVISLGLAGLSVLLFHDPDNKK